MARVGVVSSMLQCLYRIEDRALLLTHCNNYKYEALTTFEFASLSPSRSVTARKSGNTVNGGLGSIPQES